MQVPFKKKNKSGSDLTYICWPTNELSVIFDKYRHVDKQQQSNYVSRVLNTATLTYEILGGRAACAALHIP